MKMSVCLSLLTCLGICAGATQVAVAQTSKADADEESGKLATLGTYKITIDDPAAGKWSLTADIPVATPEVRYANMDSTRIVFADTEVPRNVLKADESERPQRKENSPRLVTRTFGKEFNIWILEPQEFRFSNPKLLDPKTGEPLRSCETEGNAMFVKTSRDARLVLGAIKRSRATLGAVLLPHDASSMLQRFHQIRVIVVTEEHHSVTGEANENPDSAGDEVDGPPVAGETDAAH